MPSLWKIFCIFGSYVVWDFVSYHTCPVLKWLASAAYPRIYFFFVNVTRPVRYDKYPVLWKKFLGFFFLTGTYGTHAEPCCFLPKDAIKLKYWISLAHNLVAQNRGKYSEEQCPTRLQFFILNFQPSPWAGAGELRHWEHVAAAIAAERCCGRRSPVPDDVALRRRRTVALRLAQRSQRHEHGHQHAEVSHAVPGVPRAQDYDTWVRRACYSWWARTLNCRNSHSTVYQCCGAENISFGSGPGSNNLLRYRYLENSFFELTTGKKKLGKKLIFCWHLESHRRKEQNPDNP